MDKEKINLNLNLEAEFFNVNHHLDNDILKIYNNDLKRPSTRVVASQKLKKYEIGKMACNNII